MGTIKFHQKSILYRAQNKNMTKQHVPVKSQEFRKDMEHGASAIQKQEITFREEPINGSDFSLVTSKAREKVMLHRNYKILFHTS